MKPRRTFHTVCTACLVTLLSFFFFSIPSSVFAADSTRLQEFIDSGKLSHKVRQQVEETGKAEVILQFDVADITEDINRKKKAAGLKFLDKTLRMETRDRFVSRRQNVLARLARTGGHRVLSEYDHLPMVHLEVDETALISLLEMPDVTVNEIKTYRMNLSKSLVLANVYEAQAFGFTGAGTSVAVLDTGVNYTLSAFGSCSAPGVPSTCKVAYVQDFAVNDNNLDDNGHGTNVSGIVVGVAPDTRILGLDVFSGQYAYDDDILSAVNWVIANRDVYNIAAVNMSFGDGERYSSYCTNSFATAVTNLKNNGITSAVASGNEGYLTGLSSPACGADALSVGAVYDANVGSRSWSSTTFSCTDSTTAADKVTCFSNTADYLKILAPGAMITAAGSTMGGTSQAAPHVAGAVAVLKGANPSLSVDQVVNQLTSTGAPVTDTRPNPDIIKPRLDLGSVFTSTNPVIGLDPSQLNFNMISNGILPPAQILAVRNDGVGTMNWSVGDDAAWLDENPDTGVDAGDVSVSLNTSALAAGAYTGTLSVSSPEALNSPQSVPVSLTVFDDQYAEDFETGDLSRLPWRTSGDGDWYVQDLTAYGGTTYSAQSPPMGDSETANLEVALNVTSPGYVYFYFKTSSEYYLGAGDVLKFYIDDGYAGAFAGWSGEIDWTQAVSRFEVQPGVHVFKWIYSKDISFSAGSDAVWIDDIVFPAFNLDVPDLDVVPLVHDFGVVRVGTSSVEQTFTVTNSGQGGLTISTVGLDVAGTDFSIVYDSCSGQTLPQSAGCAVDVIFEPIVSGVADNVLEFNSDDPFAPVFDIPLTATGVNYFALNVAKDGTGTGTVSSTPGGIDCGLDCTEDYAEGAIVTLSAAASGNSSFSGWSGGGCSGTGDCVVTMTGVFDVTATFTILPPLAGFSGSPVSGNAPMVVAFTDSSTNIPTFWAWDFGDGGTSAEQNPLHVFDLPGNYTVTLTVANGSGSDDEIKTSYITAGTCSNPRVSVSGVYYDTIAEAYADPLTGDGDVLALHGVSFTEDLFFDRNIDVVLSGGNNCEYTASAMGTKLTGSLTISIGTVTVENLIVM